MDTKRKAINELSTDTRILINFLEKTFITEQRTEVAYPELSATIQRDVQGKARNLLHTARKHFEETHNKLLEVVIGHGLKLTNDLIGTADHGRESIHRKTKRIIHRLQTAAAGTKLENTDLIALNSRMASFGVVSLCTKASSIKKIETRVQQNAGRELPTAETLKLFEK